MVESIIQRETDASKINAVLNDPHVRPWIANGSEIVDVTHQVADPRNIFLFGEHGGVGFLHVAQGIYECHTQVLRQGRGEWTREMTEACARYMFTKTDAYEITTRVPAGHIAAKAAAEAQGMRFEFTVPNGVMFRNKIVDCHILSFRIQDWASKATYLAKTGQWFHDRMNAEAKRLGITDEPHEPEENHNQYVGAAVEMMFGKQYLKAQSWYNRWVSLSRHARGGKLQHVQLISTEPPVIRFDGGLMRFHEDDIEVIQTC